jgi:5-formyltetrahydrofolate cyclo-ligase
VKTELRVEMRRRRRAVADPARRSTRIWDLVCREPAVERAQTIMVFTSIPGEPQTGEFIDWCRSLGKTVVVPEDDPDPISVDLVVVPGLAFTAAGDRLGQGGGWYDRFLPGLRPDALRIGVGFVEQLVDELPHEPHDVAMHRVITDAGVANGRSASPPPAQSSS